MQSVSEILALPLTQRAITIFVVVVVVSFLVRIIRGTIRKRVVDNDLRYRTAKIVGAIGYLIIFVVIIVEVGGNFSGLTVAIGAASAGIAFALQEVIASFAGWLAIALGGFYKVGDRVQLGGIKGDVIDIGLIRTTMMEIGSWVNGDLYNGRIVRVANSFVFKEPVYNYSGDFPFVWDEITLPVTYGSDYEFARELLMEAAHAVVGEYSGSAKERWAELVRTYRIEDAKIEPTATLVANDNWVEFTLRYVVDHRARRITKDHLFTAILAAVEASDGRVSLASATFQVVGMPGLQVKMESTSDEMSSSK
jgi:small-conductance mechanosensitive channel